MDTFALQHGLPCLNPNCKSHGRPHANCKCYFGGETNPNMAKGGEVHFCSNNMPHQPGCEYFAGGGAVEQKENPAVSIGHAAVHHGLTGLLSNVGKSSLQEPDKHSRLLNEVKMHRNSLANPVEGAEEPKRTLGVRLGSHMHEGNHDEASEMLHGHPLVGGLGKSHLKELMPKMSELVMKQDGDADGFRAAADYFHSAIKGHKELDQGVKSLFNGSKEKLKPDQEGREKLKEHLKDFKTNPEKMLEVGGKLSSYLPEHSAQLAATLATATDYLSTLMPPEHQLAPLDKPMPPSKAEMAVFDRQLDIAQKPLLLLQHVKNGTLIPQDITTIKTVYPGLYDSILSKAGEELIESQHKKTPIPYKERQCLSELLGVALDYTHTPEAMQQIMKAQGPQQQEQQAKGKPKKATNVELNQINKVDALSANPIASREIQDRT